MKQTFYSYSLSFFKGLSSLAFLTLLLCTGCQKKDIISFITAKNDLKDFEQVNLVANNSKYNAARVDGDFRNAWGLTFASSGVPWVNTEATGLSFVLTAAGANLRAPVLIPSPKDTMHGAPSGIVFNGTTSFKLSNKNPARFIFVGTDGVISGWNGGNKAERVMNNWATASYTGLALATSGNRSYLYAANFRMKMIEVYDSVWGKVTMAFKDPSLPSNFSPFNIQLIGEWLYVTYAAQDPKSPDDELHGAGLGFVDIFTTKGIFVKRFISRGELNAPWGIAWAPAAFSEGVQNMKGSDDNNGKGNDNNQGNDNSQCDNNGNGNNGKITQMILVGNFGDGHINAYNLNGNFLKALKTHNKTIVIDGLWALVFPPSTSTNGVDSTAVYFTAGPNTEKDGLFGYIKKTN